MRCRQCGHNVENDKAFCPVCGSPMKVTADYDYIQAEIANKVDRYISDDEDAFVQRKDLINEEEEAPGITVIGNGEARPAARQAQKNDAEQEKVSDHKRRVARNNKKLKSRNDDIKINEEVSKTKDLKIRDSVYDENGNVAQKKTVPENNHDYKAHVPPAKKGNTAGVVITALIIVIIIAAAVLGILAVLGTFSEDKNALGVSSTDIVSTNVMDGKTYDETFAITLSSSHGNPVYYTLDGTAPSQDSTQYTGPISLKDAGIKENPVTLRAVSYVSGEPGGEIKLSFYYDSKEVEVSAPVISPDAGTYSEDTSIYVTAGDGCSIYYTYDGLLPTVDADLYTGPVAMKPGTNTFKAIAVLNGVSSDVITVEYTLEYDYDTSYDTALDNLKYDLMDYGYIYDMDGNTYDGGTTQIQSLGVKEIGEYTYYVFQIDIFDSEGQYVDTLYRGVGTTYGSVYEMGKDGDSYYVN